MANVPSPAVPTPRTSSSTPSPKSSGGIDPDILAAFPEVLRTAVSKILVEDIKRCEAQAAERGIPLVDAAIRLNIIGQDRRDEMIARATALTLKNAGLDIRYEDIQYRPKQPEDLSKYITMEDARARGIVPMGVNRDTLYIGVKDKDTAIRFMDANAIGGFRKFKLWFLTPQQFSFAYEQAYAARIKETEDAIPRKRDGAGQDSETQITKFCNRVIQKAIANFASDIQLRPNRDGSLTVRMRVDGRWTRMFDRDMDSEIRQNIINWFRTKANIDIGEPRQPQDGAINVALEESSPVSIRVACVRTANDAHVVTMRLLPQATVIPSLEGLGFSPSEEPWFLQQIHQPNGIILVTGQTGTGKTTTLYSAIDLLNNDETNILTIEDPVEYRMEGVNQIEVNRACNPPIDFAAVMRSFLRHAPDVVFIGEIRDRETADEAIRAASTGQLVFSTLHTNSAEETIGRLVDILHDPKETREATTRLLMSRVRAIVAQRLVRKLCGDCSVPDLQAAKSLEEAGVAKAKAEEVRRVGAGCKSCPNCRGTGYKGRVGIFETYEVLGVTGRAGEYTGRVRKSLVEAAKEKVLAGITSIQEAERILGPGSLGITI